MWLNSIKELKQMIKLKCIVNGHNTKYWKKKLKLRQELNRR